MVAGLMTAVCLDGVVVFILLFVLFLELWNLGRHLRPTDPAQTVVDALQSRYAQGEISLPELEYRLGEFFAHSGIEIDVGLKDRAEDRYLHFFMMSLFP
ncbi:MAG: hypothetical protein M1294_08320 [Firmicutes bacterium]|uniref:SHOCT domain-containing protein n=1 Tax=Sulfobacillus benefaciens TaxID=453960 RepID=A0A2T2WZ97_9FIRM|nr:hypothetical protein [Bacillota bacterium]MCL5013403.1 hypothetical protein [Bacillota bacterium]PSR27569.1 MAG: hypothetical protein C7B43_11455 [Sulfobacillus benefaciens]